MTARALLSPVVTKEIRALLPSWSACMVAVLAGGAANDGRVFWAGVVAYAVGSVALGAQSLGHEYTHRTLGTLLSQPADRRRILLIKVAVLAAMLGILTALAYGMLFEDAVAEVRSPDRLKPLLLFPALCGLFLAPWMTMLGRSALAGVVFTIAIPGTILVGCEAIGVLRYGAASSEVDTFRLAVWPKAVVALCALGAVLGWRTFMRLEALEGTGVEIHLTRAGAGGRLRAGHPIWQLVKKEVHLQQLTFVLVGLYVVGWATLTAVKYSTPEFTEFPLLPTTMLYLVLLSMLMGSLASAGERQLGTLEWQTLLPVAAWQQWVVKVATVLALAFAFGIGLPALLIYFDPSEIEFRDALDMWRQTTVVIVVLTTGCLYVSSCSTSGLRALVWSFPAVFITAAIFARTMELTESWAFGYLISEYGGHLVRDRVRATRTLVPLTLAAGFVTLVVRLAFQNHRSTERRPLRVFAHGVWIAAFLSAGIVLWVGLLVWAYSP